jgi:hypothetical protein
MEGNLPPRKWVWMVLYLATSDTDQHMDTVFIAPEVVGRQRYGRPVDCWAIGVIMYIL